MECIAILTAAGAESAIFDPLKDKCAFWPESFEKIELEKIQCWSKIPAKYLEGFAQTTKKLFSEEYLAEAAVHVPLKCLNTICLQISDHIISETASNFNAGSDILVWIWRNRKKHTQELTKTLNMDNVIFALSQVNLPKAWGNAQRELKKLLLDKPDFQKFLIKNAEDNYSSIITAMRKSKSFSRGEQQSLLVKLSRYSPGLRDIIEKGEGKKFGRQDEAQNNLPGRPPITSMKSHRLRLKELNDIINVQIPENREALKTARAHGDFRENAEYDAAKERRDFLANRRAELESAVNSVIQTDFRNVELKGTVLPGTTVNIVYDSGKTEKFYIVGIWDGNPEKHRVSYKTRLGECLIDSKAGDKIKLPDGKTCTITEINVLPESLRAELADEI
jgi:transcription elongation GreA/GreB family factor